MSELQARIDKLEAIESIRRLKLRYAELCDRGYAPDELAGLFTEDAVWDAGERGFCRGRQAIRKYWEETGVQIPFAVHYITNHTVDVHDDTHASGRAYLWQPLVMNERAHWSATVYTEEYRREEQWRFATMKLKVALLVPCDDGTWTAAAPFLDG